MSTASNPGWFTLSDERLRQLHPELCPGGGIGHWLERRYGDPQRERSEIEWCLNRGDCRAAVVVSLAPVLVAAYSDDFDAVVLLRFPSQVAAEHALAVGTRLITVNNYQRSISRQTDFIPGPGASGLWTGFYPLIANFLTDDRLRLQQIQGQISEDEWLRAMQLGTAALQRTWVRTRDGRPRYARYGGGWLRVVLAILGALLVGSLIALKLLF